MMAVVKERPKLKRHLSALQRIRALAESCCRQLTGWPVLWKSCRSTASGTSRSRSARNAKRRKRRANTAADSSGVLSRVIHCMIPPTRARPAGNLWTDCHLLFAICHPHGAVVSRAPPRGRRLGDGYLSSRVWKFRPLHLCGAPGRKRAGVAVYHEGRSDLQVPPAADVLERRIDRPKPNWRCARRHSTRRHDEAMTLAWPSTITTRWCRVLGLSRPSSQSQYAACQPSHISTVPLAFGGAQDITPARFVPGVEQHLAGCEVGEPDCCVNRQRAGAFVAGFAALDVAAEWRQLGRASLGLCPAFLGLQIQHEAVRGRSRFVSWCRRPSSRPDSTSITRASVFWVEQM